MPPRREAAPSLASALAAMGLLAADAAAIARTYARVPPEQLYGVRHGGRRGALGRVAVFAGYPAAFVAAATLPLALARAGPSRGLRAAAGAAAALCATAAWPGVVQERRLDGGAANAVPAAGLALALGVQGAAIRRAGVGRPAPRDVRDRGRAAAALVLVAAAAPWWAAELGVHVEDLPLLGRVLISRRPTPGRPELAAVHLGHHEGLDGVLLGLCALALSREVARMPPGRLRALEGHLLALMLAYGAAVAAADGWHEQVVKRRLARRRLPDVLRPRPNRAWAALVAAAVALRRPLIGRPG